MSLLLSDLIFGLYVSLQLLMLLSAVVKATLEWLDLLPISLVLLHLQNLHQSTPFPIKHSTTGIKLNHAPNLWRILSTPHSTLHVFDWGFLSIECEFFHTLRFPIQIYGSDAGVLSVEYWEIVIGLGPGPKIYDGYSELYTQDSHSTLRIPPFKYIEFWVWSAEYPS